MTLEIPSALVTGGAGFIGSHLVNTLVSNGVRVRVLDNFSTGSRSKLEPVITKLELHEGDIRDVETCRRACENVSVIFHLAAYISAPGSVADPALADSNNISGTLNMLLAARDSGASRFVLSSSSAVYGDTPVVPTHEAVTPHPLSPYGVEKLYAENMCYVFYQLFELKTIALRYFNVYGPGQNPDSEYAAVIPKFISRTLAGKAPIIFGDGAQTRDFLYVKDVVLANLLAAANEVSFGEAYNIAGGKAISMNELAKTIIRNMGSDLKAEHAPPRKGDILNSSADITKAASVLGYQPKYDLATGLMETIRYFQMI